MSVPLFFHLTLLSFLFSTCSAICYYPDGTTAPQDVPCNDNADHSACCGQGYACLSNGVCMATGDELQKSGASTYVRGSCTDSAWRSSSCPSFCVSPLYDNVAGGNGMGLCEDTSEVLFYCIDMLSYNCTSQENVLLFVDSPSVITTIGVAASSSATSSSSSSMPVPSATPSSISSILSTSTPAAGTVGSSTAALPTASTDPEDSSQPQQGTIIGAAVGASIAGVAAGAAGLWFLLRARKNRRRPTAGNSVDGGPTSDVSAAEHPQKGYWEPPKTEGMPTHLSPCTSELDSTHRSYLASELDSTAMTQSIHELPAWGRENQY
ncbi:hypothetical protein F5883DRAFT_159453 [Diaporthe sp. PMI_573]|nr:hypothetical protein F5883DRAFT_159453 [Diaporthaceae sp. PMI_573]